MYIKSDGRVYPVEDAILWGKITEGCIPATELEWVEYTGGRHKRYTCTCPSDLIEKFGYGSKEVYDRQVVLELPEWSKERGRFIGRNISPTIAVDGCIKDAILQLWESGIETTGCCCGHNIRRAWVQVVPDDYPKMFSLAYKQRPVDIVNGEPHGLYAFYL